MNRCGGVLMHISSLPGKYGIGTLGKDALAFIDFLKESAMGAWQVLPTGPCDEYNSPYSGSSAFAGNILFIDPETLFNDGLLSEDELKALECEDIYVTQYEFVKKSRAEIFPKAFARCDAALLEKVAEFANENLWLEDYALYCVLKEKFSAPWYEWPEKIRLREASEIKKLKKEMANQILYHEFLQYEFFLQWQSVKSYANKCGIGIIGDMPIYLSYDSADVWANPEFFSINSDLTLQSCAGVPPDYFCEDGQKWGNPLYNWEKMKADGYSFWINRLKFALSSFDAVRIDHFRAFSAYWSIPAGQSAKSGKWVKGPGMDLFDKVLAQCPDANIIAEDLGEIDDDVIKLVKDSGFPGMGVMQFAFISPWDNPHLPHNYSEKTVGYTGTHDNNTILGWLWESSPEARSYALDYCDFSGDWGEGGGKSRVIHSIIQTLWRSSAVMAIVPVQDLCGFGGDTRMNRPGVAENNWCYRFTYEAQREIDTAFFKRINALYKRSTFI